MNKKIGLALLMCIPALSMANSIERDRFYQQPKPIPTVENTFSIGATLSKQDNHIEGLYQSEVKQAWGVELKNDTTFQANNPLSHTIRTKANVNYHKSDIGIDVIPDEYSFLKPRFANQLTQKDVKWINYEGQIAYAPTLTGVNGGKLYPIAGVGFEETRIGKDSKELKHNRTYATVGLGGSVPVNKDVELFAEAEYQKDLKTKTSVEFGNVIPKTVNRDGKGEKYTIEAGVKSHFKSFDEKISVSAYHSEYKKNNGYEIPLMGIIGTPVGKQSEKETGVKVSYEFH